MLRTSGKYAHRSPEVNIDRGGSGKLLEAHQPMLGRNAVQAAQQSVPSNSIDNVYNKRERQFNSWIPMEMNPKAVHTVSNQRNAVRANTVTKQSFYEARRQPLANVGSLRNSPDFRCRNVKRFTKLKENLGTNGRPSSCGWKALTNDSRIVASGTPATDGQEAEGSTPSLLHACQQRIGLLTLTSATDRAEKVHTESELSKKQQRTEIDSLGTDVNVIELHGKAYAVGKQIGEGGTAKVNIVTDLETNREYALKWIDLSTCDNMQVKVLQREIQILEKLKEVELVINLVDHEHTKNKHILMLLEKGSIDLRAHFESYDYIMSPRMIARYWLGMLRAVNAIHKLGVVHADLKPSNFVLADGKVKLIDFGVSNLLPVGNKSVTQVALMGTVGYMSPEALCACKEKEVRKIKVSKKTDVWSLGVILYRLVYRKMPFDHVGGIPAQIVATCDPKVRIPLSATSDPYVRDVLASCLQRTPTSRPTVENLIIHPYVTQYFPGRQR
uniref:Protein kinase domain-containing protein n=1 Tax=Trichuris muris TaxID=70415 RepID=A0A5S6QYE6_TRIMR